jgi:O-antigen/teichoic acid export membrane protein
VRWRLGPIVLSGLAARMARGVSWNLLGSVFNQGSTFLVNVVLAHTWGLYAFGQYAIVQSTITAVVYVAQLATGYTATRYVAQFRTNDPSRAGRLLALCTAATIAISAIAAIALFAAAATMSTAVFHDPGLEWPFYVAALVVVPGVLNAFLMGSLGGLEGYDELGKAGIASGVLYVVFCTGGAHVWGLNGAIAGLAFSAAIQSLLLVRGFRRELRRQGIRLEWAGLWQERGILGRFAIPATLSGMVAVPGIWVANAILANRGGGYDQVGLFAAANTYRAAVLFLPGIVNGVGLSLLNNQRGVGDERAYRRTFWTNLAVNAGLAALAAAAVFLLAPWLLALFGREFRGASRVLIVLMAATVCEASCIALVQPLQTQDRVWLVFAAVILPCYTILVALAWFVTPAFGAVGLGGGYLAGWGFAILSAAVLVRIFGVWESRSARLGDAGWP